VAGAFPVSVPEMVPVIVPDWPAPAAVRAAATTRVGGESTGAWASLNLGDHVGDDVATVARNRARLGATLHLPQEPLWLRQVHGVSVADGAVDGRGAEADAIIADSPGKVCAVLTADCLPVLLCDEAGTHVAAIHAGWRGLAAGVVETTVAALATRGVESAGVLAWIGPAIGAAAYEVGAEVRDAFLAADPGAHRAFAPNARGRWQFDLVAVARARLAAAGVTHVFGGDLCTASDPQRFFSHRRDGTCGRQATLIWLE
jgi:YfiH family protein